MSLLTPFARRSLAALALLCCAALPAFAAMPDFGPLRPYRIAFIRRGAAWTPERNARVDSLQQGHMDNIGRMAAAGKLVCAGPFLDGGDLRGIYLMTADSAEAAKMAAEDPAVRAGRLALELHPVMARADLGADYFAWKKLDPSRPDSMIQMSFGLLVANLARDPDPKQAATLMEQHLHHLKNEMDHGRLRVCGPLLSNGPIRGILIFDADTTEARRAAARDPMVKAGWLRVELHPWMTAYGVIPSRPHAPAASGKPAK